jgi:hypothetical protein
VSATGTISKINSAATQDDFLAVSGSTTAAAYATVYNTTGALLFGIENSVGNNLFPGATAYAAVFGTQGNTPVHIAANNAIVATVSSTGLAVTGLVDISAATSGQIKFPATQNASANANTLDDYEEGTWTPTINFSGGAGTLSYSARVGTYTKIGNTLFFNMRLVVNKGTAAGTLDNITGLPFSATTYSAGGGVYIDNCSVLSGGCQYVIPSGAVLYVYMSATGTAAAINASSMSTASVLTVSGFYVI